MNEQQTIEELQRKLDAALQDLLNQSASICESCLYCKHLHECEGENCDCYDQKCTDEFTGDCKKLVNTPCNGCDFKNHWEWRGITEAACDG